MTREKIQLGARGEQAALRFLRRRGMRLRLRNWRSRSGEVDLVMQQGETIVFVEVRARTGEALDRPLEMLTGAKQKRMVRVAEDYLHRYRLRDRPWRIDCVFVVFDGRGRAQCEHIENAV
jgi:putative endonuclease